MEQFYEWFSNNIDWIRQWAFENMLACFIIVILTLSQFFFLEKLQVETKMSERRESTIFLLTINLTAAGVGLFIQFFNVIGFLYIIFILVVDVISILDFIKQKKK